MKKIIKDENQISSKVNISKFPIDTPKFYDLGKSQDWVKALLIELNEKAENKTPADFLEETSIQLTMEIEKLFKKEYGEYLLVKATVTTDYVTQCVRTLSDMGEHFELDMSACFLIGHLETDEAFIEQMEIFEKDEIYELYFYKKGMADIAEMIHEQIYLNLNQYPISDSTTPLPQSGESSGIKH